MTSDPTPVVADRIILAVDERRAAVIGAIAAARRQIRLSLFRCGDKKILKAITEAVARGVDVKVLVTSRAKGGRKKLEKLWARLEATGATVCAYNDAVVKYHAKYLVVDDGPALVATLNFTRKCFTKTCDALAVTYDRAVIDGLQALMAADCENQPAPQTVTDRLIVGPERARRQLTRLIVEARQSIQIIDAKISDPAIVKLLNERRSAGVQVDVYDAGQVGALKSHGKLMLIDDRLAIVGSLALAALSLDFRREVALVCRDPAVVDPIRQLFGSLGTAPDHPEWQEPTRAGDPSC
jgi:cardiolipin synthase